MTDKQEPSSVELPEPDGTAEVNRVRHPEGGYEFDEAPAWSKPLVEAYAAAKVREALEEASKLSDPLACDSSATDEGCAALYRAHGIGVKQP